ncbi:MAG: helicase C-terminal domain-containing protein [Candidatus Hydrogenedentota bacterium]
MPSTLGQSTKSRFSLTAIRDLREAIAEAGGREVFCAGTLDPQGIVTAIRVCARGHSSAVPAIFDGIQPRDVVIHNHPTGDIGPSEPDLELAVVYSNNGHGVYIVDNPVENVYVIVEPFLDSSKTKLDTSDLASIMGENGPLRKSLQNFELRPQQIEMMGMVAQSFNENAIAVIEAPTGVGKTLAYLIPAVRWALQNKERVVISTRTINLQEQIIAKDIPLLQTAIEEPFNAVLVKGRSNYLCKTRLDRALSEASLFEDEDEQQMLKDIASWAEKTEDGSTADLPFVPPRGLWEKVCSESDTCTASQCQMSGNCFITKARREVAKADILVVNHHMLFSDMAIKKEMGTFTALAVLPAFERLIIDEAHHIEDSATEYFGTEVTQLGALNLFGRFIRKERGQERGLLPFIKVKLVQQAPNFSKDDQNAILDIIDLTVIPEIANLREGVVIAFQAIRSLAAERCKQVGRDIKWRLLPDIIRSSELRDIHTTLVMPVAEDTHQLVSHCNQLLSRLKRIPYDDGTEPPLSIEITQLTAYRDRLIRFANALSAGTSDKVDPTVVPWVEIESERTQIVRIIRCPLHVGDALAEWVYPNLKSITMTSATLSVAGSFDFLLERIGLEKITDRPLLMSMLDSPFDFEKQARLFLPQDIPPPDAPAFLDASIEAIGETLTVTKGHAFVLFTSFYALNVAVSKLEGMLRQQGITVLKQGKSTRSVLLERFRADSSSVLFATDSFWEGVDVAGQSLQCVILHKLPFRVPTEPIFQARAERIDKEGGSAFHDYTLPLAIIKFRQGIGRLIRTKTDRGVIVVLDTRVNQKSYGKLFLRSLPTMPTIQDTRGPVFDGVRDFLDPSNKDTK